MSDENINVNVGRGRPRCKFLEKIDDILEKSQFTRILKPYTVNKAKVVFRDCSKWKAMIFEF